MLFVHNLLIATNRQVRLSKILSADTSAQQSMLTISTFSVNFSCKSTLGSTFSSVSWQKFWSVVFHPCPWPLKATDAPWGRVAKPLIFPLTPVSPEITPGLGLVSYRSPTEPLTNTFIHVNKTQTETEKHRQHRTHKRTQTHTHSEQELC